MNTKDKADMMFNALLAAEKMNALALKVMLINYTSDSKMFVHEIAEKLSVTNPAISRTLDKLEDRGFINRKRDAKEDRRRVEISLTARGSKFIEKMTEGY
jgi:DNA-binding MarR family transcriptional regulator